MAGQQPGVFPEILLTIVQSNYDMYLEPGLEEEGVARIMEIGRQQEEMDETSTRLWNRKTAATIIVGRPMHLIEEQISAAISLLERFRAVMSVKFEGGMLCRLSS